MKIAIIEDQEKEKERLESYIEDFCSQLSLPVTIDSYKDGINIVENYHSQYDVLYFDVEMSIMDGITAAKKIREIDSQVLIVFVTNHSQVAIQGYSVEAIDFLLKPLTFFSFSEHFKKIVKKLSNSKKDSIFIKKGNKTIKLLQQEIRYIENEGHRIYIHTNKETFEINSSMKYIESTLKDYFFRSNNCYIVNLNYVERVEGNTVYIGETPLQISRPRKKEFMQSLTEFIGEELL